MKYCFYGVLFYLWNYKILLHYFYLLCDVTVHRKCYLKYKMAVSAIILNTNYPHIP